MANWMHITTCFMHLFPSFFFVFFFNFYYYFLCGRMLGSLFGRPLLWGFVFSFLTHTHTHTHTHTFNFDDCVCIDFQTGRSLEEKIFPSVSVFPGFKINKKHFTPPSLSSQICLICGCLIYFKWSQYIHGLNKNYVSGSFFSPVLCCFYASNWAKGFVQEPSLQGIPSLFSISSTTVSTDMIDRYLLMPGYDWHQRHIL